MKKKLDTLLEEAVDELLASDEDLAEFLGAWENIDTAHALHELPQSLIKTREILEFVEEAVNVIFNTVSDKVEDED